jgi:DNA ligase-1
VRNYDAICAVQGLIDIPLSITLSPTSVAAKGLVSSSRGLSLRFPRFIKVREDKAIEQASTPDFLASLWRKQQGNCPDGEDGEDLVDLDFLASSAASEDELLDEGNP